MFTIYSFYFFFQNTSPHTWPYSLLRFQIKHNLHLFHVPHWILQTKPINLCFLLLLEWASPSFSQKYFTCSRSNLHITIVSINEPNLHLWKIKITSTIKHHSAAPTLNSVVRNRTLNNHLRSTIIFFSKLFPEPPLTLSNHTTLFFLHFILSSWLTTNFSHHETFNLDVLFQHQ